MPIRRRTASMSTSGSVTSTPPTNTFPDVGCSSRFTQRSSVDFPEPDGPMTHTTSLGPTRKSMPRAPPASPNDLCRSLDPYRRRLGHPRALARLASSRRTRKLSGTVMMR